MTVLRVDPRHAYIKKESFLHIKPQHCVKQENGAWRYYLPKKLRVFILEMRVIQSRLPNTFAPVPATTIKFTSNAGTEESPQLHEFAIPLPPMGPAFSTLAKSIREWVGHNGEYTYTEKNLQGETVTTVTYDDGTDVSYADLANWPVGLEYRTLDNKFYFRRTRGDTGVLLARNVKVTGSLLPYLGFSQAQIDKLATGVGVGENDLVAEDFPGLWGDTSEVFVSFPNLPQANHDIWGHEELENVYMVLPAGAYGTEEVTSYDMDRSHIHSVAWLTNNAPHVNYIDVKFKNEENRNIDFQGRGWSLLVQLTYTSPR